MKRSVDMHTFSNNDELVDTLVDTIVHTLSEGISANGKASLAVSGGSTPVTLFEALSQRELAWEKVHICLVDERWVAPDEADSNENLVRSHLLKNRAASAVFSGMKNDAETASAGEEECSRLYKRVPSPFDVLILGMGADGHTASLFPGAARLGLATDMDSGKICMGIAPMTAPHERMTLTLPAILSSKQIYLHITGQAKRDVLELALLPGAAEEMPIRFIIEGAVKQHNRFQVYWAR
jgi:6-phosphogluconolactonase